MSVFFEIAYAAVSGRLCLFTGTGFSKAVTDNTAPSWQSLLESVSDKCEDPDGIKQSLFPDVGDNPLSLEEAAQVISIDLLKKGLSIHEEIAKLINGVSISGDNSEVTDFMSTRTFRVITTNYDKLVEELSGEQDCQSFAPGRPIPRFKSRVKVYHVHGSVDSQENMVVTSDDYFKFINRESYFSRKLSTVLHENTVVILGYSLGDTNLKAIISEYKKFSRSHFIGANIFLVSRSKVNPHIKDYYSHCYGIRVLDDLEVHDFFKKLNESMSRAEKRAASSIDNINRVVFDDKKYTDNFLKLENSFYEIVSSIAAIGLSINDPRTVTVLGQIIKSKTKLTGKDGAWEQYTHLARWLIYLSSILELKGTSIEDTFLAASLRSMETMSKKLRLGYSWHAYDSWDNGWASIIASNRTLISKHITSKTMDGDAISIVQRG